MSARASGGRKAGGRSSGAPSPRSTSGSGRKRAEAGRAASLSSGATGGSGESGSSGGNTASWRTEGITPLDLIGAIDRFASARVLIVGDAMLDEYLTGEAERISPEAPVPVVRVERSSHLAGGAGNVARNITALGGQAVLVGLRGKDRAGEDLERSLRKGGVDICLSVSSERPTTVKTRVLARQQQVVRIDREDQRPFSDAENAALLALVAEKLPGCGALVVSDYGKGFVSAGSMTALRRLVASLPSPVPVLVDPKPLNFSLYTGIDLLTPNRRETGESVNMPVQSPREVLRAGRAVLERLGCRTLVTTLGREGMAVFEDDSVTHISTTARQVFDVTGAGDTVIAVLALARAIGLPLVQSCLLANYAAGIVVGQVGAAAVTPNQLAEAVVSLPPLLSTEWGS